MNDWPLDKSLFSVSATVRCGGCGAEAPLVFRCEERHTKHLSLPFGWRHGLGPRLWQPACSGDCQLKIEEDGKKFEETVPPLRYLSDM